MEGLKQKYIIEKTSGNPVDPNAKYFVLRYDDGQSDDNHKNACRRALRVYSDAIKQHIPELSKDLEGELNNFEPSTLTDEDREQLFGEVENEGFGYWIQNYGYNERRLNGRDEKLKELCANAREALDALNTYMVQEDILEF